MTPLIQNRALEVGWPEHVAARLSTTRTPTGIGVSYGGENKQEVEDLEYGSPSQSPKSILTAFETPAMQKQINEIAENSMDELIQRMDGLFQ